MTRLKCVTFCAGLSLLAVPALAADIVTMGIGGMSGSCGDWTRSLKGSIVDVANTQWLLGLLTGVNIAAPHISDITDSAPNSAAVDWLRQYCRNHPKKTTGSAATALIVELIGPTAAAPSAEAPPDTLLPTRRR